MTMKEAIRVPEGGKKRCSPTRPSQKTHELLSRIDSLVEWKSLRERLLPAYSSDKRGAPKTDPIILVKMMLLENLFGLSDVQVSRTCDDRISFRKFLGLKKDQWAPDDSTISRFRSRLAAAGLETIIFDEIMECLEEAGYVIQEGRCIVVDGTTIKSQTNKGAKKKTPKN